MGSSLWRFVSIRNRMLYLLVLSKLSDMAVAGKVQEPQDVSANERVDART